MQERFASILTACTDEKGVVDKTRLLEVLRLSQDDPVTLVIDILIANIDISGMMVRSGERLSAKSEEVLCAQEKQSSTLLLELRGFSGKLERLLEENSQKTLAALDEVRITSQELKSEADKWAIEARFFNRKRASVFFLLGFICSASLMYLLSRLL